MAWHSLKYLLAQTTDLPASLRSINQNEVIRMNKYSITFAEQGVAIDVGKRSLFGNYSDEEICTHLAENGVPKDEIVIPRAFPKGVRYTHNF